MKLSKSLVDKIWRISISPTKNDPATEAPNDGGPRCIEKLSKKRLRRPKPRKPAISTLAGCGCQSRRGIIVLDRIPPDSSRMPEVCSVQSLPSCSSLESNVEKCPEWISSASFDEMLKLLSSSSHDGQQVHCNHKSENLSEVHISDPVKFNDLVNKFRRSEQTSTSIDQKFDAKFQPVRRGPRSSLLEAVNDSATTLVANETVQSNTEKSLISKRTDRMMGSLLIMKSSRDPQREFKDSMMEMIVENEIKDGRDLEELLACYLFLNSGDHHEVIIQVFKQIWIDLMQV